MKWILAILAATPALAATCEDLRLLDLSFSTITSAVTIVDRADLPPYCSVHATLRPSSDSDIKIEVWLPLSGWNGKYQAV